MLGYFTRTPEEAALGCLLTDLPGKPSCAEGEVGEDHCGQETRTTSRNLACSASSRHIRLKGRLHEIAALSDALEGSLPDGGVIFHQDTCEGRLKDVR